VSSVAVPPETKIHSVAVRRPVSATVQGPWAVADVQALLDLPFMDLMHRAQAVHRKHFPEGDIELATLLSVKTGGCPENCGYCPQAAQYDTGVAAQKLMEVDEVVRIAWEPPGARPRTAT
jgi:biotin synthase